MHSLLSLFMALAVVLSTLQIYAAELPPISQWKEVTVPPESHRGDYMVWYYSANHSLQNWHVFLKEGKPYAKLRRKSDPHFEMPPFTPKTKDYTYITDTSKIEDGWLVAFNEGEWGWALYWFSGDGKKNYKVSDHQVSALFLYRNVIHAIENDLRSRTGSLVSISYSKNKSRWEAETVLKLSQAPSAVSTMRDGRLLLTLSDSVVAVSPEYSYTTMLSNVDFDGLSVYSSVLSTDETKLYLGMRQYVGELDLQSIKLRLLIPSDDYLHNLPQKDADRIKKVYDTGRPD